MSRDRNIIVLINYPPAKDFSYSHKGFTYPSTSILLIGTYLKQNGYEVRILDGAYHSDYIERIKVLLNKEADHILYIGMSVMVTQIPFALEASKAIKSIQKEVPIVWGGPHATLYPEQTLKDRNVDIVVINEGMQTALNIAGCLKSGTGLEAVRGIGFKDNENQLYFTEPGDPDDIKALPFFDFTLIDVENYLNPPNNSVYKREFPYFASPLRIMPILTGLGCPYRCQFCINVILKRHYRHRSARSIVDEIKHMQKKYGANTFLFLDEDFFINKNRVLELISICEDENVHFNFRTWCRVDHFKDNYMNEDLMKRLCNIGHVSIAMGGESANLEMLKSMKKGITPEQIMHSLRVITDTSKTIFPRYSFMVGLENESFEQIKNTYKFCMEMKKVNPLVDIAGPFIFRLYPGSPIFNRLVDKYAIKIPDSLEEWSKQMTYSGSSDEMPWTPEKFRTKKDIISFYSMYALSFQSKKIQNLKQALRLLISIFCRVRLRFFFFYMPFEYQIYSFIKMKLK
ncbi:MAG: radical SAM protein [Proteobacteria bacterium]|nr:radical SAM protein [Pseudomonadota bacterium]